MANLFRCGSYIEPPVQYLYFWGNEFENVTGGWSADGYVYNKNNYTTTEGTKATDSLYIAGASSVANVFGTNESIDLTNYRYAEITYSYSAVSSSAGMVFSIISDKSTIIDSTVTTTVSAAKAESTSLLYTIRLDLSECTGKFYLVCYVFNNTAKKARVRSVQLIR